MNITHSQIDCKVKSCGPYLTALSYRVKTDSTIKIIRQKYVGGHFESNKWVTDYEQIYMGEYKVISGDVIEITNKFKQSGRTIPCNKPLRIGKNTDFPEGTSSDIYNLFIPVNCKYETITESFVDH